VLENLGNFQDVSTETGVVENRAALKLFGVPFEVKIEASCVPVIQTDPVTKKAKEKTRLAVAFRSVALELGSFPRVTIPLNWSNDGKGPEGWLDTTYLDDTMRLGRGDKGSMFVTIRRK
jgi:hypothetical protein